MTDVIAEPTEASPGAAPPLLEVEHLTVEFEVGGRWQAVVSDVGFSLAEGETLGLVGESGSGKTTTALSLLGLTPLGGRVTEGSSVRLLGDELVGLSGRALSEIRGRDVGVIFQEPRQSLNPAYTVGEQIAEVVRRHHGVGRAAAWARAVEMLELVEIPRAEQRAHDHPHRFSGGMCQRVMLAIALACEPKLLIADEPTTALDVTVQAQMLDLIAEFQSRLGLAVLFITHDLGVVAEVCDRMLVMYSGQTVEGGRTADVFAAPQHPYTAGLLASIPDLRHRADRFDFIPGSVPSPSTPVAGCRFHPRCANAVAGTCDGDPPAFTAVADGRWSRCVRSGQLDLSGVGRRDDAPATGPDRRPASDGSLAVEVDGLVKSFPTGSSLLGRPTARHLAAQDIDFTLARGSTLAVVGESGAGKSTVGRLVLRLIEPDAGDITVLDEQISGLSRRRLRDFRQRATMVFQDPYTSFDPKMPVGVAVAEPLRIHRDLRVEERARQVAALLERVGLGPAYADRLPHELSGGELQRAAIARALTTSPDLIVCDEPVAALDMSIRAQVLNLLRDLQAELGLAYLFISHDLALVRLIADEVAVMREGRIVEHGPAEQVFTTPRHEYTQALLAAVPVPDPSRRRRAGPSVDG